MEVSGKVCIGIIIGIITTITVLANVFHINVLPTLAVVGFIALISIPIILWSRSRRARSRQKVMNACVHDLELTRKLLMTEGRVTKKDAATAAELIESSEIGVYLLDNISWEGTIPAHVSSLVINAMRIEAERSDDIIEFNRPF